MSNKYFQQKILKNVRTRGEWRVKLFLTQVRDESKEFLDSRYDWNKELGVKEGDKNSWCGERRKEWKPVEKGAMR